MLIHSYYPYKLYGKLTFSRHKKTTLKDGFFIFYDDSFDKLNLNQSYKLLT